MKVLLILYLCVSIFAASIPETASDLPVSKVAASIPETASDLSAPKVEQPTMLMVRDETYSYISSISADTSFYGQLSAWGAFGICSLGWGSSVYKAYQTCRTRERNHDAPDFSCHDAIINAAQRTVLTGALLAGATNLAIASAKREAFSLEEALENYQLKMGSNRTNLSIISILSDTVFKRDESSNYHYDIVVQNNDFNSTYSRIIINNEKIGGYEFNNLEHGLSVHKRADVCYQGQKCTEAETEYFGSYYIAADICKDSDFEIYDNSGDWLSDTVGHLYGTASNGNNPYCATYFKIYTSTSVWDMSWRIYTGTGDYFWSKCDTGS